LIKIYSKDIAKDFYFKLRLSFFKRSHYYGYLSLSMALLQFNYFNYLVA